MRTEVDGVQRDKMFRALKEYSLDELLEHPVLNVDMTNRGIERRCFELIFDAAGGHHRFAEAECVAVGGELASGSILSSPG